MAPQGWEARLKAAECVSQTLHCKFLKNSIVSVFYKNIKIDKRLSNVSVVSNVMLKKNKNKNTPKAVTISI